MARPSSLTTSHLLKISQNIIHMASPDNGPRPKGHKFNMDVQIDQHWTAKAYTSGAPIVGKVIVTPTRDVAFDEFEICFTGISYTRVDFVNQYATYSNRTFMRLRMPLRASDFPSPRVFQAGNTYTIPFHFVVPHQLTLDACTHECDHPATRDHHLRLPPSVGYWEFNDQAPEMVRIEYAVTARAFRTTPEEGKTMPLEGQQLIKVLPSLPEDAPLDITAKDERYNLSKTKGIRKNIFSAKGGKVTATAAQPSAIMMSGNGLHMSESTMRINLAFDAANTDTAPPKINSVNAKLHSTTFFSSAPYNGLPNLGARVNYRAHPSLTYSTNNPITTSRVENVMWSQQTSRRDSGYSTWSTEDGSESDGSRPKDSTKKAKKSPVQHVATLDVPFAIPTTGKKLFLPSFNSCLISRAYFIQLNISVGSMNTTLSLNIPVQIAVDGMINQPPSGDELPSFESAMAQASEEETADDPLQPRLMQVPSLRFQGNSILPGYNVRTVAVA